MLYFLHTSFTLHSHYIYILTERPVVLSNAIFCSGRELITEEPSDFHCGKLGKGDKIIQNLRSDKRHKNCEIQIVSDFNVNNLNFAQHELTNTYLETMFSNNLLPVITRPTRIHHTSCELEILRQNQLDSKDFLLISSVFDL